MEITFVEDDSNITFVVRRFAGVYEPVLRSLFFQPQDDSYVKTFPKDLRHMEQTRRNFAAHAEEMLAQHGYLRPTPWEDALEAVSQRLREANIDWWLTGSCAAAVRGVVLCPCDVDVMLDPADHEKVADLLADWMIKPIIDTQGWVTKLFGVAFPRARVDLAFGPQPALDEPELSDSGPYAAAHLEAIRWRDYELRLPPLALQAATNKRRGRLDRAAAIERVTRSDR